MTPAQAITKHFKGDWHTDYGSFPTPGHGADDRGMTVRDGKNGDVTFNSFNGGDWRSIKDQCRVEGLLPEFTSAAWRTTDIYEYADVDGTVAYRTRRLEKDGERKRFVAERSDGRGGWTMGIKDLERIPYRLPELLAVTDDKPVLFVEGERKADKLASWGFNATAIAFGAKGWRREYAAHLASRRVIILPDNDPPGRDFAVTVKSALPRAVILELPGLPPGGDIIDWDGGAEDLLELVESALAAPVADEPLPTNPGLPLIDIGAWQGPPPARISLWGDWLPIRQTTMLTGSGGIGKSLFEQMLCTCIALGLPFLGMETVQTNTLYVTCEDDADELWRRQDAICKALGLPMADTIGKLHLCSLTGQPGVALAAPGADGSLEPLQRWHELEATCEAISIGLYAFDNATDAMAGDLNDVHQVAEFVNLLTGLAIRRNGVAMILHHPNKAGDDWLGSVAWHNKVRSRLIVKHGDDESDSDARIIENPKANYGPQGGKIAFRWFQGAFLREEDLPANMGVEIAANVKANAENGAFLACLRERTAQGDGRAVGPSPGPNYAPSQFEGMTQAKGLRKRALKHAMDRLFAIGAIESCTYRNAAKSRDVTIIRETDQSSRTFPNAIPNASRTPFPNPPEPAPDVARAHTLISKDINGASTGTAAPLVEVRKAPDLSRVVFAAEPVDFPAEPNLNAGYVDEGDPLPGFDDMAPAARPQPVNQQELPA